jgi:hypothetical protein
VVKKRGQCTLLLFSIYQVLFFILTMNKNTFLLLLCNYGRFCSVYLTANISNPLFVTIIGLTRVVTGPDRFTFFPTGYNSGSDTLFSLHRSNFCRFISSLDNSYAKHSLKRYENIFRQFCS